MTIRKVITNNGKTRWEVDCYADGRGTRRLRRRFKRQVEAESFEKHHGEKKDELKSFSNGTNKFEDTDFIKESTYWLDNRGKTFSPAYQKRAGGIVKKLVLQFGKLRPDDFHSALLTSIQSDLLNNGKKPATVNRTIEVIKAIFSFSHLNLRIPFNPTAGFKKLKLKNRDAIDFWEEGEAKEFLEFADRKYPKGSSNRWIYVVYLTTINTGMRAGELWGLQPRDIVSGGEEIKVDRQFERTTKTFQLPKGGKTRKAPCNPSLLEELKDLINEGNIALTATIFSGENKDPIRHENFRARRYMKDIAESGIRPIRFRSESVV